MRFVGRPEQLPSALPHADADAQVAEALARVMAANASPHKTPGGR